MYFRKKMKSFAQEGVFKSSPAAATRMVILGLSPKEDDCKAGFAADGRSIKF